MNLGQSFAMGNHHKIFWKRKTVQPGRINDYFDVPRIRFAVPEDGFAQSPVPFIMVVMMMMVQAS
jgi:hypothetical protein